MFKSAKYVLLFGMALLGYAGYSGSVEPEKRASSVELDKHLHEVIESRISPILQHPAIIDAIKVQNQRHARFSQRDIEALDREYTVAVKENREDYLGQILGTTLSKELKKIKASNGKLFTEIFVMDNKGLNVGQSDITSDYWQGDEDKWQRTYLLGPHAVYVGVLDFDDSTKKYQIQVSGTVSERGIPIGAITFGVDPSKL